VPPPSPGLDSLEDILEPNRPQPVGGDRTEKHPGLPPALEAERRPPGDRHPSGQRLQPPPRPAPVPAPAPAARPRGGPWMLLVAALVLIALVAGGLLLFRDQLFGQTRGPAQVEPIQPAGR
jgi:hypothetical protein